MNKIRIEDLSVGDWVILESFSDCPMKVDYILPNGLVGVVTPDGRDGIETYPDKLSAVLITPEILEKNGFEENCGRWYNSEALMEFELYKDSWCRTINCGEYSVYSIKYVHQLQHALRLVNNKREIVL